LVEKKKIKKNSGIKENNNKDDKIEENKINENKSWADIVDDDLSEIKIKDDLSTIKQKLKDLELNIFKISI